MSKTKMTFLMKESSTATMALGFLFFYYLKNSSQLWQ